MGQMGQPGLFQANPFWPIFWRAEKGQGPKILASLACFTV